MTDDEKPKVETPKFLALVAELEGRLAAAGMTKEKVVLVGSATLAMYGLRDVNDLDVLVAHDWDVDALVTKAGFREREEYPAHSCAYVSAAGVLHVGTDLGNEAVGLEWRHIADGAEPWRDWKVLGIEHCITIKNNAARAKDRADVYLLESLYRQVDLSGTNSDFACPSCMEELDLTDMRTDQILEEGNEIECHACYRIFTITAVDWEPTVYVRTPGRRTDS